MHEYVTVSSSSYDPAALAAKLTEKSREGWEVVSIVPTGGDVTAFLRRGDSAATTDSAVAPAAAGTLDEAPTAELTVAEEVAAAVPVAVAEPVAESAPAEFSSWSSQSDAAELVHGSDPASSTYEPTAAPEPAATEPSGWSYEPTPAVAPEEPAPWSATTDAAADSAASSVSESEGDAAVDAGSSATGWAAGATSAATGAADGWAASTGSDAVEEVATVVDSDPTPTPPAPEPEPASPVTATVQTTSYEPTAAVPETPATVVTVPAGWYADPSGRYELRYWDGLQWTEHVARGGQQYTDPPVA